MRPLVQCDDTIMTLTASGKGYSQLFVDREGDSPISVFNLPPNCGYSVSASCNDLVVAAPYDGCYMTQENGSYVLPLLWWDSPLKLSCPVQKTPPSPPLTLSVPSVLCLPYGVVVHMYETEEEMPTLGTYPQPLDSVTPAPSTTTPSPPPPQSPTQGHVVQRPDLLNYPYPGFQYPQHLQHTTLVTPESNTFTSPTSPTSTATPVMSPTPQPPAPPSPKPARLRCLSERMAVFLPSPHPDSIQVRVLTADFKKAWLPLLSVSPLCKYMLVPTKEPGLIFHSPLPACHSQQKTPTTLSLQLRFWDVSLANNRILELQCPYRPPPETPAQSPPLPPNTTVTTRARAIFREIITPPPPMPEVPSSPPMPEIPLRAPLARPKMSPHAVPSQGCNIPKDQRLPCGTGALTQPRCLSMGCCFNKRPPACYYPMDECTLDRNFVFTVPASLTDPPLSPALLVAPGNTSCKPQRVTPDYALFQIPVDSCGARRVVLGKTLIYILEIVNKVESITHYTTITRDSPVRILVECRYPPDHPVVTAGYMTKSPSLGPSVPGQGVFGVQLRIAKDAQYKSYHTQYHMPMRMLLGEPLYLEVRLVNPPDHQLVLLVHYCVAYPRSGEAMWVLLYKECPNPFDPAAHILPCPESQTRRFTINTFQFLQQGKTDDLDQEVYFMCSTEACVPQDGPCVEGCLGQ
ncbi:unnamed protein product [Merluccius merluccius]